MVERVQHTPHRARGLCCHEAKWSEDNKALPHSQQVAGQPGRHRCNQIPRGRDQRTDWARAPHRSNRGGKGSKDRQRGSRQTPNKQDTSKRAQPHRGAQSRGRNTKRHESGSLTPTAPRTQEGRARKGTRQRNKDEGRKRQHDQVEAAPEKQKANRGAARAGTPPGWERGPTQP